ncbi:MAG: hypothetical protein WAR77_05975, partial [Saprospiraceae bacterium]
GCRLFAYRTFLTSYPGFAGAVFLIKGRFKTILLNKFDYSYTKLFWVIKDLSLNKCDIAVL